MTAAVRLAARHALLPADVGGLGRARVVLRAAAGNTASRRVAERAGFRRTGVDRQAELLGDGTVDDLVRFDLLPRSSHALTARPPPGTAQVCRRPLAGSAIVEAPRARERLSAAQARRVALAAQGFAVPRRPASAGPVTMRQVQAVIDRVGVVQIDSVNVFSRSHYMPFFSRLGPYDRALPDRAAAHRPRRLVEYWAHEASFVPPSTHRLLRFRMARAHDEAWGGMIRTARELPDVLATVRGVVADHGPLTAARDRAAAGGARDEGANWGWNWSRQNVPWSSCSGPG